MKTIKTFLATFVLIGLIAVQVGCEYKSNPISSESPLASIENTAQSDRGPITLLTVDNSKLVSLHKDEVDSSTFYAEAFMEAKDGGKLEIKDDLNGDSKIEIEDDALPEDMTVVFKWTENNIYQGSIYNKNDPQSDFTFAEPVKLKLTYEWADLVNVDEDNLGLYFYNTENGTWDKIECEIDTKDDKIEAELTQSGTFRILEEIDGGLLEFHKRDPETFFASKFIEAHKGGEIKLGNGDAGKSKIKFEKNDLPYDALIEFEWAADGTIDGTFAPHGLNFNNPVRVEFSYKLAAVEGFNEEALQIYYYNEDRGIWEFIGGTVDTKKQIIIAYLEHFSRYAVAYGN